MYDSDFTDFSVDLQQYEGDPQLYSSITKIVKCNIE
jgi:hypothetical protein